MPARIVSDGLPLETELMILDLLVDQAIDTCLANAQAAKVLGRETVRLALLRVDKASERFRSLHPDHTHAEQLRFRMNLLQFTARFTQRLTRNSTTLDPDVLPDHWEDHPGQTDGWYVGEPMPTDGVSEILDICVPLPAAVIKSNRAAVLNSMGLPAEDEPIEHQFYGSWQNLSLHDLVADFVYLCEDYSRMFNIHVSHDWIRTVMDLMSQAALEQFMCSQNCAGKEALTGNFWLAYQANLGLQFAKSIYGKEDVKQFWVRSRQAALNEFQALSNASTFVTDLQDLAAVRPHVNTENNITAVLQNMSQTLPVPTLALLQDEDAAEEQGGEKAQLLVDLRQVIAAVSDDNAVSHCAGDDEPIEMLDEWGKRVLQNTNLVTILPHSP